MLVNRPLNRPGSQKEVRHFQLSLAGSGLNYEVGDALGVYPANCPGAVENIIQALRCQGDEPVPANQGQVISLREALLRHYEIKQIPPALLQCVAEKTGDANLRRLISPTANGETTQFLWGREIIDLLRDYPSVRFAPDEFTALLKKLAPRYYSIASSLQAHPGEVHLTVSVLRYECLGYPRLGVCSAYLADRIPADGRVPVFLQRNQNFRLPAQRDAPLIMVGPGTGIAPFRAFLQERRARGGRGRTWLFFGEQHAATDFLYQEELESFVRDGTLSRLATAFSRDQSDKLYVQHRMLEQQREIFAWLEDGAHFYVCGDARRMAKDVEATLRQIIVDAGGQTPEQAVAYLQQMRVDKRYQRDVY